MTTFITGGTSSIGRVLVRALSADGEAARVLVRPTSKRSDLELPGVEMAFGDVTDAASLRAGMAGCDQVVHLAAVVGGRAPEETWWRVNRDGTRAVLQCAAELGVQRLVQVSSISTLGPTQPGEIADETRPVDPGRYFNLYQKTKHAADELTREYAARGLPASIVYPCFGFGCSSAASHPSMQETTLLRMAAGKPVATFGSGRNRLTLSYYDDTARGIRLALQHGQPGEGYILGGDCLTFPQIWAEIARLLGKRPPRARIPLGLLQAVNGLAARLRGQPVFPEDFFEMVAYDWAFCSDKARRCLGWQPTPFPVALSATWRAYQRAGWRVK